MDAGTALPRVDLGVPYGKPALKFRAKAQLKCEVIFLTHKDGLHDISLAWHPRAEEWLWRPDIQERKCSRSGMVNLRCKAAWKRKYLGQQREALPHCEVRYAF